ncbi:hypothetical protein DMB38_20140 [Streptomyces sp. WAC 06738]|uniref:hypothetical protein n=1 Tax=Streptomyces sp. WAC 06738 TaxID=2203210 RepID=UPI000F6E93FD|nr:hypothetical protein [Streptomyces sp. WAC 06738]AZM47789.1 hypothetical protein DMB38_20140 [Streptomyces sp. WAC 06738]
MIGYADLDDDEEIPTEVFVVWEHLIGLPGPRYSENRFRRLIRWNRRAAALDLFEETNGSAVGELWHLWTREVNIALVTFLPEEMAGHLATRIEAEALPASRLVVTTPNEMARLIGLLGHTHIFHSLPDQTLRYGPRGIYVHPQNPELMRAVI